MIFKVAFSLPINYPSRKLFNHTNKLPIYKLYIGKIQIKSIQMHIINTTGIIDQITGKFIKEPYTLLTSSRNSSKYTTKTVFNNLNTEVKSPIKKSM